MFDMELRIAHGFDHGNQEWHVFGSAARHHAGDGDGEDGDFATFLRHGAQYFVGVAIGEFEKGIHAFARRWNDRHPVSP